MRNTRMWRGVILLSAILFLHPSVGQAAWYYATSSNGALYEHFTNPAETNVWDSSMNAVETTYSPDRDGDTSNAPTGFYVFNGNTPAGNISVADIALPICSNASAGMQVQLNVYMNTGGMIDARAGHDQTPDRVILSNNVLPSCTPTVFTANTQNWVHFAVGTTSPIVVSYPSFPFMVLSTVGNHSADMVNQTIPGLTWTHSKLQDSQYASVNTGASYLTVADVVSRTSPSIAMQMFGVSGYGADNRMQYLDPLSSYTQGSAGEYFPDFALQTYTYTPPDMGTTWTPPSCDASIASCGGVSTSTSWNNAWIATTTATSSFVWQTFSLPHDTSYYFPSFVAATTTGLDGISDNIGNFFGMIGSWITGVFRISIDTITSLIRYLFIPQSLPSFSNVTLADKLPFAYFTYVFSVQPQSASSTPYALTVPNYADGGTLDLTPSWDKIVGSGTMATTMKDFLTTLIILVMLGGLVAYIKLT